MTVTGLIDIAEAEEELSVFIKNNDIMTITTRGVATVTATGTFASDSSFVIANSNVRNIRSVTVGGSPLTFGTDYTVDYHFLDTTYKCKITFTAAQTGAYSIPYDHGTSDKIYTDWPQDTLSISSYPRIVIEITNAPHKESSLDGAHTETEFLITASVFGKGKTEVNDYIKTIRQKFLENKTNFYFVPYIKPLTTGPLLPQPSRADKIFGRNYEMRGMFKQEIAS